MLRGTPTAIPILIPGEVAEAVSLTPKCAGDTTGVAVMLMSDTDMEMEL